MSRPASVTRATAALTAMELRLTSRRGENVLVTLIIPTAVLLFFASAGIVPGIAGRPVDFLLPGALSLAIIASGLVNLGIATAYERSYGVLKRLGGSPLPRTGLVAAKVASVVLLEVLQIAVLFGVAVLVLGWSPGGSASIVLFLAAVVLGTLAFAGLGLLLAGTIRAEATLALANGLFLAFLMVGGIVLPLDHLPGPLEPIARLLPAGALSELLRAALGGAASGVTLAVVVLATWAAGAIGLAVRFFRWE
jgi:ABC-2 type transport system permease protein